MKDSTKERLGLIAGSICLIALILIGWVGVVMVWAACGELKRAVRP